MARIEQEDPELAGLLREFGQLEWTLDWARFKRLIREHLVDCLETARAQLRAA
jgi:hypothetical protein